MSKSNGNGNGNGSWGSDYDGFQTANKSRRAHPKILERAGREMPAQPSQDVPMRRFRDNIDIDTLELFMSEHDKYAAFIIALHHPDHARLSFATICRKFNVTLHELQMLYTDGMRHIGLLNIANKLPQVMEDVAEDALAHQVLCARCDGKKTLVEVVERDEKTGKILRTGERPCPVCNASGQVREVGDKHARDLVFESMKLTKLSGPLVAINQTFGNDAAGLDSKMEGMLKLTQGITLGERKENMKESV